jgi:hypothetical protein
MEEESVTFSSTANQTELWHKRLGHFNQVTLVHMQKKKKKIVQRMPNLEEEILVCTSCQYGKQNRLPFPLNKARRAIEKLQLI